MTLHPINITLWHHSLHLQAVYNPAEKKIYLHGPLFNGKWTQSDMGQAKFRGVDPDGITAYMTWCDVARQGRRPEKLPIEEALLKAVRLELDIQGATFEEERARKRRRTNRPVAAQPQMAEEEALAMFQDEGEDEEE